MAGRGGALKRQAKPSAEALRKREERKRKRMERAAAELRAAGIPVEPASDVGAVGAVDAFAADVPTMETVPVEGPGADAFAPEVPAAPAESTSDDAPVSEGPERPLVEPPPPPPVVEPEAKPARPAVTDVEAMPIAFAIGAFFQGGANALLRKRPDVRLAIAEAIQSTAGPGVNPDPAAHVADIAAFVRGSTVEVCKRWNIRFPYLQEAVVAGAVGIGAFGFIVKAEPGAVASTSTRARVAPPPEPDAPPPVEPAGGASTTARVPPIPWAPEVVS